MVGLPWEEGAVERERQQSRSGGHSTASRLKGRGLDDVGPIGAADAGKKHERRVDGVPDAWMLRRGTIAARRGRSLGCC